MVNINCGACGHLNTKGDCNLTACIFPCNFGTGSYVNKPITNADRIRSMSDEELASKFEEIELNAVKAYGNDYMLLAGELREYWLDWLKKKAEKPKKEVSDNNAIYK